MKISNLIEAKKQTHFSVNISGLTELGEFNRSFPDTISGGFNCAYLNGLTSLKGSPRRVQGDYLCNVDENLITLAGAPEHVGGTFYCFESNLKSLKGAPRFVGGGFDCSRNRLTSLEGAPDYVGGNFDCSLNKITTLKGIGRSYLKECMGIIKIPCSVLTSNILGLLLIKNLTSINFNSDNFKNNEAPNILMKHFNSNKDVLECQEELISAGLKEFAKL